MIQGASRGIKKERSKTNRDRRSQRVRSGGNPK